MSNNKAITYESRLFGNLHPAKDVMQAEATTHPPHNNFIVNVIPFFHHFFNAYYNNPTTYIRYPNNLGSMIVCRHADYKDFATVTYQK